jgi:hypothetical protein
MARKPENTFIARVNKYVDPAVHREKMANPYRRGTADMWYSGTRGDMWIEFKWLPRVPSRGSLKPYKLLEALQRKWLDERHAEGRKVALCIGTPLGGMILGGIEWHYDIPPWSTDSLLCTARELGSIINACCLPS